MQVLGPELFREILLSRTPILDVRAPVEFAVGHIPGAINIPILSDSERHEIGTLYKEKGHEAAVRRGHELVSGATKEERVEAWAQLARREERLILTCFRGGMRSRLSQQWLAAVGVQRPRLAGGYKAFRRFLIDELERLARAPFLVVSGATGAGKTVALNAARSTRAVLDLEGHARHRGSSFGGLLESQPSQINFENEVARALLECEGSPQPILIEDESRMIGRIALPESIFSAIRGSKVVLIEEPLESRVELTYKSYVTDVPVKDRTQVFENYRQALARITRKLGGARYAEIADDLEQAIAAGDDAHLHRRWIEKTLAWYYDPLYNKSLERRKPEIAFKGSRSEVLDFLQVAK